MGMEDKIEKIEKLSSMDKESKVDSVNNSHESHFEEVMKNVEPSKDIQVRQSTETQPTTETENGVKKPSLMDEVQNVYKNSGKKISTEDLIASLNSTQERLTTLKTTFIDKASKGKDLNFSPEITKTLEKKLSNIDDNLTVAAQRVKTETGGLEVLPSNVAAPHTESSLKTPFERFLGFVTDSEHKLQTINSNVEQFALDGKSMSPATMLLVQIKVGYIQQELELFTNLLNKSLESTKTIMNVQI